MPVETETYRDKGYNGFLERSESRLVDIPGALPGEIGPTTDLANSTTDPGNALTGSTISIGRDVASSLRSDGDGNTWWGAREFANAPARITNLGAATFTNLTINGGSIDLGGNDATSFHVDADGNMWVGAGTFAAAPWRVANDGDMDVGGTDATSWHVDKDGNMWSGAATFVAGTTPLTLSNSGTITATLFQTNVSPSKRVEMLDDDIKLYDSSNNLKVTIDSAGGTAIDIDAMSINLSGGGNLNVSDTSWVGMAASSGRIVFDDATPDNIEFRNASVVFNGDSDADNAAIAIDDDDANVEACLALRETSAPTSSNNFGKLYTKNNAGTTELYFMDDTGTETKLA